MQSVMLGVIGFCIPGITHHINQISNIQRAQFSTGQESVLPEIPEFCWAIIIFIIVRPLPELAIRVVVCVFSKDAAMRLGGWILPIKLVPE